MGSYVSYYERDLVSIPVLIKNTVLLFEIDSSNTVGSVSSTELDNQYLPAIFLAENKLITNPKEKYCTLLNTPRYAVLYITTTNYLKLILPYKPGSENHLIFFQQAKANNLIINIATSGERYTNDLVRKYGNA